MQEITGNSIIDINLNGIIRLGQSSGKIECIVRDVTEDYTEIGVIVFGQLASEEEEAVLSIFLPTERTPIKCAGIITRYPENNVSSENQEKFPAQIAITNMGRIDRRRLELFVAQKKAFISSGAIQGSVY